MFALLVRIPLVFVLLVAAAFVLMFVMAGAGEIKPQESWVWLDIVGEGGAALLVLCWLFWVARSRPGGRVTRALLGGLALVFLAAWADALDEIIRLPVSVQWDHWIESVLMPAGLLWLTLGIFHWHQEQLAINRHMHKRERLFREHRHFDSLIPLTGAAYLRRQLQRELKLLARGERSGFALIVLDLNRFTDINLLHGFAEGDRVLQAVSQLLWLNLRREDLLCRLAGDRFVVLLPATDVAETSAIASDLKLAIGSLAHRTENGRLRLQLAASVWVVIPQADENAESLLQRLGQTTVSPAVTPLAFV